MIIIQSLFLSLIIVCCAVKMSPMGSIPVKKGRAIRSIGCTHLIICGDIFILHEGAASDLFRFRQTVSLDPVGKMYPEKYGWHHIVIPGKGEFFVLHKKLWGIVNPKGSAGSTQIYKMTGVLKDGC